MTNLIQGARQVLVLAPSADYIHPSRGDFRHDVRTLRGDARRVSQDLYTTTIKHGQQVQNG